MRRSIPGAAVFLALAPVLAAQPRPALTDPDRIRIAEAYRLAAALGDRLWPGWTGAPFALLLVSADHEFLIHHPRPSAEFTPLGDDSLLGASVFVRPRQFAPDLLATFPAVGGVPTIVMGVAERTSARISTRWVLTLLHEHFHQLQNAQPGYYQGVEALGLSGGDQTGMWMLNYPFPYANPEVARRASELAAALRSALATPGTELGTRLAEYRRARAALGAALADPDHRYLAFQAWQEGIALYTEHRVAEWAAAEYQPSPAFQALPDYTSFAAELARLRAALERQLNPLRLDQVQRVGFYALGAAEGLLLDRARPDWRSRYFQDRFTLEAAFRP